MAVLRKAWGFALAAVAMSLAAAVALGPSAKYAHFARVEHAVCAEHGELVHVESTGTRVHAGHTAAPHVDPAPNAEGGEHEHRHCGLATQERPHGARAADCAHAGDPAADEDATRSVVRDAVPRRALYRLAPKTSPPHCA
jgi:hypothetical protein